MILNKELEMRTNDNESSEFAWYSSYETLGAVDGPGLRLVIFLQGCPLQCLFCHNPETTPMTTKENKITIDEIIELYEKNRSFYDIKGGVTLSGGEAMAQPNFVIALFTKLQSMGIHTCLDTAAGPLSVLPPATVKKLLDVTDLFLIDIKHPDKEVSIGLTGHDSQNQLDLVKLCEQTKTHYWVRHVYVPTFSDAKPEHMLNLGQMLGNLRYMDKFELLPYHNMAEVKYDNLGWGYQLHDIEPPTPEQIAAGMKLLNAGMKVSRDDVSKGLIVQYEK